MNNKRNRNTTPVRNEAYWSGLVERFFAAQTSEAEEKELREFLLSPRGADARYDEVRAVMSFLAVGRDVYGGHAATPSRPVVLPLGGNLRSSASASQPSILRAVRFKRCSICLKADRSTDDSFSLWSFTILNYLWRLSI